MNVGVVVLAVLVVWSAVSILISVLVGGMAAERDRRPNPTPAPPRLVPAVERRHEADHGSAHRIAS